MHVEITPPLFRSVCVCVCVNMCTNVCMCTCVNVLSGCRSHQEQPLLEDKQSFMYESYVIHVLSSDDLFYICLAEPRTPRSSAFRVLDMVKQYWIGMILHNQFGATPGALRIIHRQFIPLLVLCCIFCGSVCVVWENQQHSDQYGDLGQSATAYQMSSDFSSSIKSILVHSRSVYVCVCVVCSWRCVPILTSFQLAAWCAGI